MSSNILWNIGSTPAAQISMLGKITGLAMAPMAACSTFGTCLKFAMDAINRGERALNDMGLYGIRTTIPYYLEILNNPEFHSGSFNTGFIEAHPELTDYSFKRRRDDLAAALAVAVAAHAGL